MRKKGYPKKCMFGCGEVIYMLECWDGRWRPWDFPKGDGEWHPHDCR